MSVLEEYVSIQAAPAVVERHLTERTLVEQWLSPLVDMELITGEWMAEGSTYRLRLKTLALLPVATYTLAKRDSHSITLEFDGLWKGIEYWHWSGDSSRTVVQNSIEYQMPNPWLHVLLYGLVFFIQVDMRVQMAQLKRAIENPRPLPEQSEVSVEERKHLPAEGTPSVEKGT